MPDTPKSLGQENRKSFSLMSSMLAPEILDSMADGVYVTDPGRQIVFWNRAAERITGWSQAEVVGRSCYDNVLIHVDKDGHRLCGEEFCPLHRAIVANQASAEPLLVYAQAKSGKRVPVEVSVAPIHGANGAVVGGIEVFRDLSAAAEDLRCAQLIQQNMLATALPKDPRYRFGIRYVPRDLIGGDFYRLEAVGTDGYVGMVADVMGHGVSAALYTMQLRALWEDFRSQLAAPAAFFENVNAGLHQLAHGNDYFATGFFFHLDAASGRMRHVNAGHPAPIVLRRSGATEFLGGHGPGLGLFVPAAYPEGETVLAPGDTLVAYTDGAVEIFNAAGEEMQDAGLVEALRHANAAAPDFDFDRLEEYLLKYSNGIRFPDDLTVLRVHRTG